MNRLRHLTHLVARFIGSLGERPPTVEDELWAEAWLSAPERKLWSRLSNADRRHSIAVARRFACPGRTRSEVAGALLHDIGKIESDLGVIQRVVATIVGPRTTRYRRYHDHESIGAGLLEGVGSDPTTVAIVAGSHPVAAEVASADDAVVFSP